MFYAKACLGHWKRWDKNSFGRGLFPILSFIVLHSMLNDVHHTCNQHFHMTYIRLTGSCIRHHSTTCGQDWHFEHQKYTLFLNFKYAIFFFTKARLVWYVYVIIQKISWNIINKYHFHQYYISCISIKKSLAFLGEKRNPNVAEKVQQL